MKTVFAAWLGLGLLLSAGCASTDNRKADDSEPKVSAPAPPVKKRVAKGEQKPKPHAAIPAQPLDGGASKADQTPQTRQPWLPNVLVPAYYPQKALDMGVEGYVILEFTVTRTGSLQDIVVIESSPPGYFEDAALRAATGFRYEPRIVNGEPVDVPRAQYKMVFKLEYLRPK
jgi:TonB family protein